MLRPALWLLSAACLSVTALAACGSGEEEGPARSGLPVTTTSTTAPSDEPAADDDEPSVSIASPQDGAAVPGNVVTLEVHVTGIEIVSADGDTSGTTGHLHVFVDREPPPVGEVIPREPGIIHTTESTIVVPGLPPSDHRLVVTLGDGEHRRISEELTAEVTVTVE